MNDWYDPWADPPVQPRCIDCGCRVETKSDPSGVFQCIGCAAGEVVKPQPTCLRCRQAIEDGPLCDGCEAAIEAKRERVLRYVQDRWPAILKRMEEGLGRHPEG